MCKELYTNGGDCSSFLLEIRHERIRPLLYRSWILKGAWYLLRMIKGPEEEEEEEEEILIVIIISRREILISRGLEL